MSLNDDQLIDLGETLLKDYKYSVILYKNSSAIIFNSNYKIKSSNIENIFFETIEKTFNSLNTLSRKILDICQLVWLTKNTSYENVGGIFLRKNTIDS